MTTRTRSQIPAMSGDIDPLREILQELAQLREEQKMEREQIQQELRQRGDITPNGTGDRSDKSLQ